MLFPVMGLARVGFDILASSCTAEVLRLNGIRCADVLQDFETAAASERKAVSVNLDGEVVMVINPPYGNSGPRVDGSEIRTAAVARDIPCVTTIQGAAAAVQGIEALIRGEMYVRPLQALQE